MASDHFLNFSVLRAKVYFHGWLDISYSLLVDPVHWS